ncbi:hypothetical protein DL766_007078 [Monosporascus sp. MC13-8B]|uniref:Amino acid permease/ SLC12A domain-containing protein n=1 Tax=Monosporascus cannonballus TaxID=155416 RepID=A0ABY0GRW0_9PEZI|nr:hypothetical protein DL762_010130 [Monosporascus cannonballus]RYO89943.1 hypothetical protein DL763_005499 [Monosporascus cannonballus]RYP25359.1 hypothetical protein DL766_007078 [Monosporascus sp. MC13-8B]
MTQSLPARVPDWVPDWFPDWVIGANNGEPDREHATETVARPEPNAILATSSLLPSSHTPDTSSDIDLHNVATQVRKERTIAITQNQNRTVQRKLQGIHLFMITINATLGTGLYWRGGLILQLGGPLAVLLSFLLLGLLAWAVMQCITEMLCIWPIPGALSMYVSEFVDEELGVAVGIAYCVLSYTSSVDYLKRTEHHASIGNFDTQAAANWGTALLMSMSTAAFSYVGVEIVAASAMEIRWPKSKERTDSDLSSHSELSSLIGKTVKFSAIWISVLATITYSVSGILVSFNLPRNSCRLPRFSWAPSEACEVQEAEAKTSSAFVTIADLSEIPGLAHVFNFFLVFTALTCAMTNLYVASRSLFGLTSRLDDSPGQPWFLRALAWLGKTNKHKVPMRAMVTSALAFVWVPFLRLEGGEASNNISSFIEVLGNMGSNGVIIVWACECVAFLRFYYCIKRHRWILQERRVPQVRRWIYEDRDYPYRSHLQPFTGYMALIGCLFLLFVSNGAFLWNGPHPEPFLSSYLIVIIFLGIWILLKFIRDARWSLVDLSNPNRVIQKIRNLHDIRQGAR